MSCSAVQKIGIVATRDEVERVPHQRRLHDVAGEERALERLALEGRRARPDADIRRGRPLRLHAAEPFDHGGTPSALPLEQQLPRERRAVQLALRQDAFRHRRRLLVGVGLSAGDPRVDVRVEVEGDAPELDAAAGEHGVLGDRGEADVVLGLVPVVRDADAAGVHVERAVDPPRPLQMRVAAGEHVDAAAAEQPLRLAVGRLGQHDVVVRGRRAVEGAQLEAALDLEIERRGPRRHLLEVPRLEPRERPRAHLELRAVTGSGESSGTRSRKSSLLPSTTGHSSAASRSSTSAGCGPPCTASPRQTTRSIPSRSSSATTAASATSLPWMSETSASGTALR